MPEQQTSKSWQESLRRIEEVKQSGNLELNLSLLALAELPDSLAELSNLRSLNLIGNQLTALPDSIAQLSNLQSLNVRGNRLTALPDSIFQLSNLQSLDLGSNQLAALPVSIAQLSNLQSLNLGSNQFTAFPISIAQLSNLQSLNLWHNQLSTLPDSISQLSILQSLNLGGNQLAALPDSIAQLSNLHFLYLHANQFSEVPDPVTQLLNLQELHLDSNQLSAIPEWLAKLDKLEKLDLSNNRLSTIPESLAALPKLTALFLHGNPALNIPDEILGPGFHELRPGKPAKPPREIFAYLNKMGDSRPLNEAKLIMVGYGAVGKSSLVEKITTGRFKLGKKATEGIKISDWACPLNRKDKVTVHIWDFGGQEMMHATHQFFLTQRSLYLLVLNRRQGGADREADYWFRLIRAFGGKDAPVIVVLHKQKLEPFDVNRGSWLEKYAGNIKGFVETDCIDAKSINLLKRRISEELQNLTSIKASFPRRWFAIKNELSLMKDQYVTFAEYQDICKKYGEPDAGNQASLAGFLHDLGIALNYREDPRLRFAYVLKPEWVTEGIYALLHAFVKSKGLFERAEAEKALKPKGYSQEAAEFILGLMEQFELSFPLGGKNGHILIPQLLEDQQPGEALGFQPAECLNFGYQYTVVPEGLLPRFIVRTHHLSQPGTRWKSGVILRDESSGCQALVRADVTAGQVRVHIAGREGARRELLGMIRYNFDVIHSDYEFKPSALVYPAGAPEQPQRLDELEALSRNGATVREVVLQDMSVIKPTISSLVEPVRPLSAPLKMFLSYAHKDEKYLNELRKDLKLMERNGLIRVWYDRAISAGEKWEAQILQELNQADVIVCQLSRDFLASAFCVLEELDRAIQKQEAGEARLIAYVLTDCGWQEVEKLKQFQVLPKDAKPLVDWKDKNKYWRAVAEGIQVAIKAQQRLTIAGSHGWRVKPTVPDPK